RTTQRAGHQSQRARSAHDDDDDDADAPDRKRMAMEIFADGELEEAMRKNDKLQANSLASWWRLFSSSYEELIQSITKPVRATYTLADLGARAFTVAPPGGEPFAAVREDVQLVNTRNETLECSFWHRTDRAGAQPPPPPPSRKRASSDPRSSSASSVDSAAEEEEEEEKLLLQRLESPPVAAAGPCVLYLHEMSSSRKECAYMRETVLAAGFSLFALDLSGSGKSAGDRVSFGHFEQDDVRAALDFLYATGRASSVSIWGRGIGGAAALLHLRGAASVHYKSLLLTRAQARALEVVEDRASGRLLCARPSALRLPFRFTRADVSNGDLELLSIGDEPVRGLSAAQCMERLAGSSPHARVRVAGFAKAAAAASGGGAPQQDPFVTALTVDCAFGDLEQVIADSMDMVSASAQRRSLAVPAAMVAAAALVIGRSVRKTGGFALRDVRPLDDAPRFQYPCLFLCASKKDFFTPAHTLALHAKYGGPKALLQFDGAHEQNRSDAVLDAVLRHFQRHATSAI
ncbi:hypothetical protein PybrP1_002984, partial [[Pythium] brassicae (nom. inval.)]